MRHPLAPLVLHPLWVVGFLAGAPAQALAQDGLGAYPIDIEMLRPSFLPHGPAGVASPAAMRKGTVAYGLNLQIERDPLRLYEYDELVGSVVRNRTAYHLGGVYATSDRLALTFNLPFARHTGSEIPELAGDGWGLGDVSGGLQGRVGTWNRFTLGLHGELLIPVGAQNRYMGERGPRARFGANGLLRFGPVAVVSDLAVHARQAIVTQEDLIAGSELLWNSGVQWDIAPDVVSAYASVLTRGSFVGFAPNSGENGVEGLIGVRTTMQSGARLDLGIGRGLNEGYGTTGLRVYAGMTFVRVPELKPVVEAPVEEEPMFGVEDEPEPPPVVEAQPNWQPGELARVEEDEIIIRDPIQFEFATTNILPVSIPTLQAVAAVMEANPRIGHLVIEGHASREGSFIYNYDLSMRRAEAIFREVVQAGVQPSRLSFVGFGEVDPVAVGEQEGELAPNRRVVFRIVRQYRSNERIPTAPPTIRLPWDGSAVPVGGAAKAPETPIAPAPSEPLPPPAAAPEVAPPTPPAAPPQEGP
jgi:outer membrane protein OmpA-like peptidoglycan-associated protein